MAILEVNDETLLPAIAKIDWVEVVDQPRSPRITLETDRSSATRTIDVPYYYAENFAEWVTGYSKAVDENPISNPAITHAYISRNTPWRLPLRNNTGIFCSKCTIEGYGVPTNGNAGVSFATPHPKGLAFNPASKEKDLMRVATGGPDSWMANYDTGRLTIEYETPTYEVLSDSDLSNYNGPLLQGAGPDKPAHHYDESTWARYITKIIRPQGEFLTIQGSKNNGYYAAKLKVSGNAFPINESINKSILATTMSVTWHQVPRAAVPMRAYNRAATNLAIDRCLGRVNDRLFNGYPQGTLMLMSADIQPHKNSIGARFFDIVYQFKEFCPLEQKLFTTAGVDVYAGHNHVYLTTPRVKGVTLASGASAATAGWYEVVADDTLATSAPYTNFAAKKPGINLYDFANFANLFRPAAYTQV